ncbi:hypothetical protein B0J18DRAFT_187776 [Chaetomium sp. MPI-SDFR-AT-0129]|nr:hypothetical protein B0J18DRAFT_187776 [Chaetomium sp. MPI-SDFR-AT-0129]
MTAPAAANRLTFLYPHLFRAGGRWSEPAASHAVRSSRRRNGNAPSARPPSCQHVAHFTTPSVGRHAPFAKRAGKGIEPMTLESEKQQAKEAAEEGKPEQKEKRTVEEKSEPKGKPNEPLKTRAKGKPKGKGKEEVTQQAESVKTKAAAAETPPSKPDAAPPPSGEATQQTAQTPQPDLPSTIELPPPSDIDPVTQAKRGSPMDEILHMGPPPDSTSAEGTSDAASSSIPNTSTNPPNGATTDPSPSTSATKPPHLVPTQYIHHFDSYTLVKHLTAGGYTLPQAILSMKAIRTLLASNLDVAQAGLVSKANVENETYLFRAACSELSAEVRNNRRVADEQLRQQRTLLQHEVDILTQRLNQELLTLTDSVRGMFNDRGMAVREEHKTVESRIQQINYKISVTLNSDAKSDIEALRWVLIRRSVLGIIFMAVLTLGTLRYATYVGHRRTQEALEADRRAREAEEMKKHDGRSDQSPGPDAAEILAAS